MSNYEWKEIDGGLECRVEGGWPFMRARVYCDFDRGWTYQIITSIGSEDVIISTTGTLGGNGDLRQSRVEDAENVMDALAKLRKK